MKRLRQALLSAALAAPLAGVAPAHAQLLDSLKQRLETGNDASAPAAGTGTGTGAGAIPKNGASSAMAGMADALGFSMPVMNAGTLGNAAGVLQYCIQNNYLNAQSAGGIKERLMGMMGGGQTQKSGFATGTQGMLQGANGQKFDLRQAGDKLKAKACDYVLSNAKSLL